MHAVADEAASPRGVEPGPQISGCGNREKAGVNAWISV